MQFIESKLGALSRTGVTLFTTGALAAAGLVAVPAANATPFTDHVVINEVESNGDSRDWIELYNKSGAPITFVNAAVADSDNTHVVTISGTIPAGGYYVVDTDDPTTSGNFGLGNADSARLYAEGVTPTTGSPVDSYSWTAHAATSYGRSPNGTGSFVTLNATSKGATNVFTSPGTNPDPAPWQKVVINEVESNGDTRDWVELYNTDDVDDVDISGMIVSDDNNGQQVEVPDNTVLPANGYVTIDVNDPATTGNFGLGGNDEVRLFAPGTVDISKAVADGWTIDRVKWSTHAPTTYGLQRSAPTDKGILRTTLASTKGTANTFSTTTPPVLTSAQVVINEVESNPQASPVPAVAGDWVELANKTNAPLDVGNLVLSDSDNTHTAAIPAGTFIPANGYLTFRLDDDAPTGPTGNFGLGNVDSARLFNQGADLATSTPIDQTSWTAHATTTWGRIADITGTFQNTSAPTPNAANN